MNNISLICNSKDCNTFRGAKRALAWSNEPVQKKPSPELALQCQTSEFEKMEEELKLSLVETSSNSLSVPLVVLDDEKRSMVTDLCLFVTQAFIKICSCPSCLKLLCTSVNSDIETLLGRNLEPALYPADNIFTLFHSVFSCFLAAQDSLARFSRVVNVGVLLKKVSSNFLKGVSALSPFCEKHSEKYVETLINLAVDNLLRTFARSISDNFTEHRKESRRTKSQAKKEKDRKYEIFKANS